MKNSYPSTPSRLLVLACVLVLTLCGLGTPAAAQNVVLTPGNGALLPCQSSGSSYRGGATTSVSKVGLSAGLYSLWRHKQLMLTFTSSDGWGLREDGKLEINNNNLTCDADSTSIVAAIKWDHGLFLTLDLPQGYRIRGYKFVFTRHDGNSDLCKNQSGSIEQTGNLTMKEYGHSYYHHGDVMGDGTTLDLETDNYGCAKILNIEDSNVLNSVTASGTDTVTLTRVGVNDEDMGNLLYFGLFSDYGSLSSTSNLYGGVEFIYAEVDFTWDGFWTGTSTALSADSVFTDGVSFKRIWFDTGMELFGEVSSTTTGSTGGGGGGSSSGTGTTRYVYNYENAYELYGPLLFYEKATVDTTQDDALDIVVPYEENEYGHQSITGVLDKNGAFAFKLDKDDDNDGIYFIETPCYTRTQAGSKYPLHYRMTGAKLNFTADYQSVSYTTETKTINTFTTNGSAYLNYDGESASTSSDATTEWAISSDGKISCVANGATYYLVATVSSSGSGPQSSTSATVSFSTSESDATAFSSTTSSNKTYYYYAYTSSSSSGGGGGGGGQSSSTNYYLCYNNGLTLSSSSSHSSGPSQGGSSSSVPNNALYLTSTTGTVQVATFGSDALSDYTVTIYGRDGVTVAGSATVSSGNDYSFDFDSFGGNNYLNNDAVKFVVSGPAIVNFDVEMQTLFPYVDRIRMKCYDFDGVAKGLSMEAGFACDNFSFAGGDFYCYMPDVCDGDSCMAYVDRLYSVDQDNSYYSDMDATTIRNGLTRISFVNSPYYELFAPTTCDNQYSASGYSSDYNVYSHPEYAVDWDYNDKIYTLYSHTEPFTFNNTDSVSANGGYFMEYFYTINNYKKQGGDFRQIKFKYTKGTAHQDTAYYVICDETRYNIAPTLGSEHRYYADYLVRIHIIGDTPKPHYDIVQIYDSAQTCLPGPEQHNYYGITVTDANGTSANAVVDNITLYVTLQDTMKALNAKGIDLRPERVLYMDASAFRSLLEVTNVDSIAASEGLTQEELDSLKAACHTYPELNSEFAPNALIYIPYQGSMNSANAIYMEDTIVKARQTVMDYVIRDKNPIYVPIGFSVHPAYYATYAREITNNTVDTICSIILPYSLYLDGNGVHESTFDGVESKFTVYELDTDACMYTPEDLTSGAGDYIGDNENFDFDEYANFVVVDSTRTKANVPYVLHVNSFESDGNTNFVVSQLGGDVYATTAHKKQGYIAGTASSGTMSTTEEDGSTSEASYTFTPKGTYSGQLLTVADNEVFYFAKSRFVNIKNIKKSTTLKIYPMRMYIDYDGSVSGNQLFSYFGLVFGAQRGATYDEDVTTGIELVGDVPAEADLAVIPCTGTITLCSKADQVVSIYSTDGRRVARVKMGAGEERTVSVPGSATYVVNEAKVFVK